MTIEAGPPAQPPQLSPDRKWFWDGSQWRPFAQHEAVFPTWQSVGAGLPPEQPAPVQRIPTPPPTTRPAARPAPAYVVPAPAPGIEAPLWQEPPTAGVNRYLYIAAGAIALVIVAVILNSLGTISLPWQSSSGQSRPTAAPGVSGATDAARADSFANGVLAPRISAIEDSVTLAGQTCAAGMTSGCQDALVQVDNKTSAALSAVDRVTVPICIAPQAAAVRVDLSKLDTAAVAALKGFRDNRAAEMQSGFAQVGPVNAQLRADNGALTVAVKACATPSPT